MTTQEVFDIDNPFFLLKYINIIKTIKNGISRAKQYEK